MTTTERRTVGAATPGQPCRIGIDVGSTTAKIVALDAGHQILFAEYVRHNAEVFPTLLGMLERAHARFGDARVSVAITGTAGMGVAERTGIHFIQEVVSSANVVQRLHPEVRTLIDLGGEDAKIIFFNEKMKPDIRMNGNCAGGTGAFIDQMATLLHISVEDLDHWAAQSTSIYPIASRCGVFAKTDVQNLISRDIPREDIAASIFRAVAIQSVNSLSRGFKVTPTVLFSGGPLTFLPMLRQAFKDVLHLDESQTFVPERPELITAIGAALSEGKERTDLGLAGLIARVRAGSEDTRTAGPGGLAALFSDAGELQAWLRAKNAHRVEQVPLAGLDGEDCFLGVDSGSTTTKIVLTDARGRIGLTHYATNDGNPIEAVLRGLRGLRERLAEAGVAPRIVRTAVTGYGEDLIRSALRIDDGIVETIAHYRAARFFDPEVSFILDIGGQDMKAIFVRDGVINDLEINEACSSGAGSFIQTFARSLGYDVADFAAVACEAKHPCDLGTRCTVFMNSKVKQALREGATVGDISAGLAYSVVKNCFNKVLKISNPDLLGDHVVVQGGTFRNPAVLRALELVTGKSVVRPDVAELMGAFGAALFTIDQHRLAGARPSEFIGLDNLERAQGYDRKTLLCRGCENTCTITRLSFEGSRIFFTGNKCERIYTNQGTDRKKGQNLHDLKRKLLWDRSGDPEGTGRMKIGLPRALNLFESFPYWNTLLTGCGFRVVLSSPSNMKLADKGAGTVMSENICFPAKLTNGHIFDLIEKRVDRILFPMVRYEADEYPEAVNFYNCPIITGYPDVIRSSVDPALRHGVPFDKPEISFASRELLERSSWAYLKAFGIKRKLFERAFARAVAEQDAFKARVREEGARIVEHSEKHDELLIMLIGRPYHVDPLVNHKITEMITSLGVSVITEDSIPLAERSDLSETGILTQWAYPNRMYDAAIWAGERRNVEVVQLNSFGCGPDAVAVDEVKAILAQYGKTHTLVRIDEITSPGSVKLRIRSLIESVRMRGQAPAPSFRKQTEVKVFGEEDRHRKIIAPFVSAFFTPFFTSVMQDLGYDLEILPMPDRASVETGLKYSNNDICYPATIVIGDFIKALQSGKYDPDKTAVGLSQTGGQCRASSYVSLLKKALIRAGFENVPIIALATGTSSSGTGHQQPGFKPSGFRIKTAGLLCIIFSDAIAKMHYFTAVREKTRGESWKLAESYLARAVEFAEVSKAPGLFRLLEEAVEAFNRIEIHEGDYPKVGLVGEIFVKFNDFGNGYVADWLMSQGVEVVLPPILDFFVKRFVNDEFNVDNHLMAKGALYLPGLRAMERVVESLIWRVNRIMKGFRVYRPFHTIRSVAARAEQVLSLTNQFGEAWLLPSEISQFAEEGIPDVVCLQPFGCIANHIIAKGVEKRLKDLHPELNILYLDMDAGASEVNVVNRLKFLVNGAVESAKNRGAA